jgi:hypothetical protein
MTVCSKFLFILISHFHQIKSSKPPNNKIYLITNLLVRLVDFMPAELFSIPKNVGTMQYCTVPVDTVLCSEIGSALSFIANAIFLQIFFVG